MNKTFIAAALSSAATAVIVALAMSQTSPQTMEYFETEEDGYYYTYPADNKIQSLMEMLGNHYVDTLDMNELAEKALPEILGQLDPHSAYFPAKEATSANDELRGNFSGIGITFVVQQDTIVVMSTIPSGPSENVGIMPGDRIVKIDDEEFVGKEVCSDTGAIRRLRGPQGTKVRLSVARRSEKKPKLFTITRDNVQVKSIDCSYMINDNTGYIHVKNFGENTYREMLCALLEMMTGKLDNIVIDLRGNSGGYLQTAVLMANEFLERHSLIVYTEGAFAPREDLKSDGRGSFCKQRLAVLIDEGSASSSEIFAGAIQDNDRGIILGRRSFGKGLVQQPINFSDGSQIRLTVARYYTPSGRCIQRPYVPGHDEDYENDLMLRYERGEFFSLDSIHQEGPEYKTLKKGRTVYGGGGITPDIFIPEDTTAYTSYYRQALYLGLFRQFAFEYSDSHRASLGSISDVSRFKIVLRQDNVMDKFATFAASHGLPRNQTEINKSLPLFERYLYGSIIYNVFDSDIYQQYLNLYDPVVKSALEELKKKP